ncbi:hypothetical protein F4821DRAFT_263538 [Hypoxylon rubiginosum]|uniref:Uncharacterized protein n=1 Tax=Hypoxylon rubiginosum TaxID=110542 RepID=A0ACC0CQV3_9PEZI|nr:hypothetical protein F4821DRAFT_263538 [Hypoxylon rubiginosum]
MCYYRSITVYACGHEALGEDAVANSPLCLCGANENNPASELGRLRVVEGRRAEYCDSCKRVENSFKTRGTTQKDFVPRVTSAESAKSANDRAMLAQMAGPTPEPAKPRKEQINDTAIAELEYYLKNNPSIFNDANFMWFVMFIASLPSWVDRPVLISELEPWFAELFDETSQFCVRPALRSMNCEWTLDDVMCWKRHSTVWITEDNVNAMNNVNAIDNTICV